LAEEKERDFVSNESLKWCIFRGIVHACASETRGKWEQVWRRCSSESAMLLGALGRLRLAGIAFILDVALKKAETRLSNLIFALDYFTFVSLTFKIMERKPFIFSQHLETRLQERNLKREWIEDTLENPDSKEEVEVDETHFFKRILEAASRCLKVVLNPLTNIVITAHFDRKKTKNDCK
jgi:hypothetical protein